MSLLGVRVTLLIGPTVPVIAPLPLLEALQSVEIQHADEGRSGFQLVFRLSRDPKSVMDYALLALPLLRPGNRVILVVTYSILPTVLMDGIITNQQLSPADGQNPATLTLTGEDVSVMMDREEKTAEHPAQPEMAIATKIIASYAAYGMVPAVLPPPSIDVPLPTDRVPVQQATDLQYLRQIAERFHYVFYVTPGPAVGTNTAYWGPKVRVGLPQRALSVDMGPETNVATVNFRNDATSPTLVSGTVQDRQTNQQVPVQTAASAQPPLAAEPALANPALARTTRFRAESGQTAAQAMAHAQAATDASTDVITVEGELSTSSYGAPLQARGLVGLRGAGFQYDGLYYVQKVVHTIQPGEYKQKFTLRREGLGSTVPTVIS